MSEYVKPLPVLGDDLSRAYWEAAREGRLLVQRCRACGEHQLYPRGHCVHCFAPDPEWVEAKGTDGMKRLYRSPEPDNAILVFDAYKEAMAQEAAAPKVDAAGKAKKDIDGLHGESLKGRREVKTLATKEGGGDRPEDFDDGFEKGAK